MCCDALRPGQKWGPCSLCHPVHDIVRSATRHQDGHWMKRDEVGRLTRQKDINAEVALYTFNVGEHPGRTLGSGRYQLTAETPDLYAEVVSGSNPSAVLLSGRLPVSDVPLSITPISALSSPDVSVPGFARRRVRGLRRHSRHDRVKYGVRIV